MNKLNKKSIYISIIIITVGALSGLSSIIAKFAIVNNEKRFCRILNKPRYNLAVVMFYDSGRWQKEQDSHLYYMINNAKAMFRGTSGVFRYNDADVMFITVNVSKRKKKSKRCRSKYSCVGEYGFKQQYGIRSQPKFMLFRNGEPHKDSGGQIASLTGFITRSQLEKLIDSNFGRLIERNRKRNADIRQRRIESNMAAWAAWGPYWGPGCGWGGCGWGGCGWGAGCGWGCRRCW